MDSKNTRLVDAFEVCLAAMATGVDLEACLKLYPDLEADLRPSLLAAARVRHLSQAEVPAAAFDRSRARMLAKAEGLRRTQRRSQRPAFWQALPRLAMATVALVLVLVLSLNGLVNVSAKSLPGDTLYPVKLAAENVSIQLAANTETRLKMEEAYQERRAGEIRSLIEQERVHRVSFEGVVEEVNGDRLLVQGIPVVLGANAVVIGEVAPGRLVEVEGTTQPGGWVNADEMHLRFFEYVGQLHEIQPGLWRIGDRYLVILSQTHLDPTLRLGEQVLALVYAGDDGTQYAQAILRVPETLAEPQDEFEPFEIEFTGAVQAISGNELVIDGKTVQLTADTEIKGDIAIGSLLKVHAVVSEDGSLLAREIQTVGAQDASGDDDGDNSGSGGDDDNSGGDEDGSGDDDNSGSGSDDDEDSGDGDSGGDDDNSGSGGDDDDDSGGDDDNSGNGDDDDDNSGSGGDDDEDSGDDDSGGDDDNSGSDDDDDDDSGGDDDNSGNGDDDDDNSGSGSNDGD